VRKGWPVRRLGDLSCLITKGTTPTSIGHAFVPEGINFLKVESISENGQFIESKIARITQECHDALRRSQLKSGDILFSIAGALGRAAFVTEDIVPANTNQALAIIRLKQSDDVLPKYVLKTLATGTVLEQIEKFKGGVAQQNLSLAQVRDFEIPLPPLPEQQRIVGILDEAFEGIATAKANAEKNLLNARAIFESHLQSVFTQRGEGWVERRLGDLATFRNGINFTKSSLGDSVKIVGVKDFRNNFLAPLDSLDTVTIDGKLPDTDILKENDLLFVRSNGNTELIGRCLLVGVVAETITHSGFTIRARIHSSSLTPKYLCHFLKSNKAKREMIDSGIGTNIKSLNQATLSALVIPFPPSAMQSRIVCQLDALNAETQRLESLYQQKLDALDELKKSLLHQAFAGQL